MVYSCCDIADARRHGVWRRAGWRRRGGRGHRRQGRVPRPEGQTLEEMIPSSWNLSTTGSEEWPKSIFQSHKKSPRSVTLLMDLGLTWDNFAADVCLRYPGINNIKLSNLAPIRSVASYKGCMKRVPPVMYRHLTRNLYDWMNELLLQLSISADPEWQLCCGPRPSIFILLRQEMICTIESGSKFIFHRTFHRSLPRNSAYRSG